MIKLIVYHCIGAGKLRVALFNGYLKAPVKAWKLIGSAERFSKQTGRAIILRLKFPDDKSVKPLNGHRGEAVYINGVYHLKNIFGPHKLR